MRFLVGADLHLGNHKRHGGAVQSGLNERARDILHVLTRAIELANRQHATLVIAGDALDESRPTPGILAAFQKALAKAELRPVLLAGNHEWGSATDHALRPLWSVADVVETLSLFGGLKPGTGPMLAWPWWPGRERFDVNRFTLVGGAPAVVVMHTGVIHDGTPPYLVSEKVPTADEVFDALDRLGASVAITGDWHDHKVLERLGSRGQDLTIVQCGALVPTGFDNPGLDYGYMVLIDPARPLELELHQLPGPRFLQPAGPGEVLGLKDTFESWTRLYVEALSPEVAAAADTLALEPEAQRLGRAVKVDRLPVSITDRAALLESVGTSSLEAVVRAWAKANAPDDPDLADELLRRLALAKDKIAV